MLPASGVAQQNAARPGARGFDHDLTDGITEDALGLAIGPCLPAALVGHLHGDRLAGAEAGFDGGFAQAMPAKRCRRVGGVVERRDMRGVRVTMAVVGIT